jgi:hypothetical protein
MKDLHVFLDFDGVLNDCGGSHWSHNHPHAYQILPKQCSILNRMLQQTPHKLIISSAWKRCVEKFGVAAFDWMLLTHGIKSHVSDTTKMIDDWDANSRQQTILEYIHEHNVTNYIVFDDLPMPLLSSRQIQPASNVGLVESHIAQFNILCL